MHSRATANGGACARATQHYLVLFIAHLRSRSGWLNCWAVLWSAFPLTSHSSRTGTVLYFGYMFIISSSFFLLTGTIGFLACFWFVRVIYGAIKVD